MERSSTLGVVPGLTTAQAPRIGTQREGGRTAGEVSCSKSSTPSGKQPQQVPGRQGRPAGRVHVGMDRDEEEFLQSHAP